MTPMTPEAPNLPRAVQAFARMQRVIAVVRAHPNGLAIADVAAELGVPADQLHRELLEYYGTDLPSDLLFGLQRPGNIEFLAADGSSEDPATAVRLRISSMRPEAELGVEFLRTAQLADLHRAAMTLLDLEPDNAELASAVAKLEEQFLAGGSAGATDSSPVTEKLQQFREAITERRRVRIEYSRAWEPGVYTRDIEPWELNLTGRGWELDAGQVHDGTARTYLLDRVRSVTVLPEHFERPEDLRDRLERERRLTSVDLVVPQGTHWVVDRFAERTEVLESDAEDLSLRAWFLPPVRDRVALTVTIAGGAAFVVDADGSTDPDDLTAAAAEHARRLHDQHLL